MGCGMWGMGGVAAVFSCRASGGACLGMGGVARVFRGMGWPMFAAAPLRAALRGRSSRLLLPVIGLQRKIVPGGQVVIRVSALRPRRLHELAPATFGRTPGFGGGR